MDKNADNIQVMVRVRPLNDREKREGAKSCIILDDENPNNIIIDAKPEPKQFKFDFVGGEKTSQEDIFQIAAKPLMMAALEGYNACIFAYGQTGAGKTFTMQGRGLEEDRDSKERGVQPRVFDHLFALTNQQKKEGNVEYLVKCSYLEIYNEQIMDLLSNTQSNLMVREDLKKGVYIEGLTEEIAKNSDETIQLLLRGMRNRHVGATNMNFESSRSHSVFSMTIESKKTTDGMINVKVSKLHFVDLAGSERQKQTAAAGERLKEASNINKSLTTLGLVINSLVEQAQGKSRHIPYRDSKLTFLLKDSLGGNSRTYMIAAVSAASTSFQETLSTLQFAQRAKQIKNKASINEEAQGNVESLKKEIKRLKEDLAQSKNIIVNLEEQLKNGTFQPNQMEIEEEGEEDLVGSISKSKSKQAATQLFSELEAKEIISINNRCLEVEEDFKKQLVQIQTVIDEQISPEINKKDKYLQAYQTGVEFQDSSESHYKAILQLFQVRVARLQNLLTQKYDENLYKQTISENQILINEQYEELLKLMAETPNIMSVYDENVNLKQKLEQIEQTHDPSFLMNVQWFVENIKQIQEIGSKIDNSLEERRFVKERLEKFNMIKMPTPEKIKVIEDQMHNQKIEHNEQIQKLNYDLANLKQKEHAQERALDQEKNKVQQLKQEIIKIKEQRAKDLENHQQEIEELLNQFNQIDNQKTQASDEYQQNIGQLNRKIIELETKYSNQKQQLIEAQSELQSKENLLTQEQKIKEQIQKELNDKIDSFSIEKCEMENKISALKNKLQLVTEELTQSIEVSQGYQQRISQLETQEESHKLQYEQMLKEKAEEIKKLEHQFNEKQDELIHIQQQMEQEDDKIANFEAEKNKIQEEYGILNDTYNYQQQLLEEKNSQIAQMEEDIKNKEKEIGYLKNKLENFSQEETELFGSSSQTQTQGKKEINESLLLKQNKELQEQNHQLRVQVEFEANSNISQRSQMNTLSNRVNELTNSEKHFRTAYLEVRNQLQNLSQRNKDLQNALTSKEMEHFELQRDMKSANENVQFLQERIVSVKNEMKVKEREALEADNRLKKCKESVIKLQENLRQKMDNLQQALMKNGELETKMAVLQREAAQLKNEIKSKSSLSEKRVQELLQSFAQQRTEMSQMQKIINSKIEENISLTANNRLLQNLVEKYTTNEWELKQQYKTMQEKFAKDEINYKKRIDHLIQEYGKLEQETVCNQELEQLQDMKNLLESKSKEQEQTIKNKDCQIKSLQKEKDILQKENEKLDKQIYDFKQQQQYILKEKDSIIGQLQTTVMEKEKELKDVNSKIASIQQGIQQAQQYYHKYQQSSEENKKLKVDIELKDQTIKQLENQLGNFSINPGKQSQRPEDPNKYKEKFIALDEKYQGLKKKYLTLQQQYQQLQQSFGELQTNLQNLQNVNGPKNENQSGEIKILQQQVERYKLECQQYLKQIASLTSQGDNDIPQFLSSQVNQLCEFVLSELECRGKDLILNIPKLNGTIEQNLMFMVHAFNNLFTDIKNKEQQIQQMLQNEIKSNKKFSSLEKEVLILKKKMSNMQPSTASSSAIPTPKASVTNSVYKMPNHSSMNPMNNMSIINNNFNHSIMSSSNNSLNNSFSYKNSINSKNQFGGKDFFNQIYLKYFQFLQLINQITKIIQKEIGNNEPLPGESIMKKVKY
ncbi:kinesin motor catalytic domain protein (macronuclear) [Tetrahymena thermophila SB210]|uniref:Kinesin motor catalytic domain protein n=1 Tax=Tetrahymena thermophila (strain SB210) TaxID=312017 RepID=I7M9I3_TETTS|nr:kinesin motor catalytic domain protein [Tetrahymena thermophila SB210]EAS01807.2 kinesin motor catalytic domain protein [Tetrahymena thermophila SB210]|eukprot:XP_001022052.2 kinesin motor catalytic domain protein [Tetrahymena thermophila SB210]